MFKWSHSPPSKTVIDKCTSTSRLLNLRASGAGVKTSNSLSDVEWKTLARCKRLYAACLLDAVISGQSKVTICTSHKIDEKVLDELFNSTKLLSSKLKRFCGEVGWISLERMIADLKPNLETMVPLELKDLIQLPTMNMKAARVLYDSGIQNVANLADSQAKDVANRLLLGLAFESTVCYYLNRAFCNTL